MTSTQFKFNSVYKPVFYSKARYIDIFGGRGRGGSHFVTDYFLFKLMQPEYFRGYFMRSVLNDIRESLWRDFKDRIDEKEIDETLFRIDENKMTCTYTPTGNTIISKGFKKSSGAQTAKLKSIAGATHVAIEEAEEISEDEFTTLNVSLRTVKTKPQIFRIFNPPEKSHWLWKNYTLTPAGIDDYFTATPNYSNPELLSIFSTYHDNIENLDKTFVGELEKFKSTNPDYYWSNVVGLVSSGKKGRIFKNYQTYTELPAGRVYRLIGIDWGYSPDPTVFVEININREQKELYIREHHRQTEMSIEEIHSRLKMINPEGDEIVCDNAERREYNALLAYGMNIFRGQKGPGSRGAGRDLMKNFKLFVHVDSKDYLSELENHTWALDANKMPTGKPIDGWDHGIDATIYALRYYVKNYGI